MRTAIILVIFSLCSGFVQAQTTTEEAEAIKATLTAMWDAMGKGDLDRYAS
jgi:hypothetical protein